VARLINSVESLFETDFAILQAAQDGGDISPGMSFATSAPGFVSLQGGTKYSTIHIVAERWDAPPPLVDGWDDYDELPFEEVVNGGPLILSGFDRGTVGLDIRGLGWGLAQVFARGRHRYQYNSDIAPGQYTPEEWLVRLYPTGGPASALAGGPRRIAGEGGLCVPAGTPWEEAVRGLSTTGWSHVMLGSRAYSLATSSLQSAPGPLTPQELAEAMSRRMPPLQDGGIDAASMEVAPYPGHDDAPDPLASHSGLDTIRTVGDAIDALRAIGLLLAERRGDRELLVVNPAPEPAWQRLGLTGDALVSVRQQALRGQANGVDDDIVAAIRWAGPEGLHGSVRRMAMRWASGTAQVTSAVRMLTGDGTAVADRELGFDARLDSDEEFTLWLGPHSRG
jgi:hypothetical protein